MKKLLILVSAAFALALSGCSGSGSSAVDRDVRAPAPTPVPDAFGNTRFFDIRLDNPALFNSGSNDITEGSDFNSNRIYDAVSRGYLAKSSDNIADRVDVTPTGFLSECCGNSIALDKSGHNNQISNLSSRQFTDHFTAHIVADYFTRVDDRGLTFTTYVSEDIDYTLVGRINNSYLAEERRKYAQVVAQQYYEAPNNWVSGGMWGILRDTSESGNVIRDHLREARRNDLLSANCTHPCEDIDLIEFGFFVDGAPWLTAEGEVPTLPTEGSATYANDNHVLAPSFINPDDPTDQRLLGLLPAFFTSSAVELNVDFAGDNTRISGTLGNASATSPLYFNLASTNWDPDIGSTLDGGQNFYGGFYGADTLTCAGALAAAVCGISTSSEFAAQFYGQNSTIQTTTPRLLGGIYSIGGTSLPVYFNEDGSPTITPIAGQDPTQYEGNVSGAFHAVKQ